ncbi:MAG: protoheme IX farnesyltransferase [Bosea sp.]|jgi:hypothetical protein|nr:protoheme IX farnesyltransferase [Bosea sp. (in: a-proteobacteria)]
MAERFPVPPKLSPDEERVRRRRSMAIAVALGALAVIFYAVSMVKIVA